MFNPCKVQKNTKTFIHCQAIFSIDLLFKLSPKTTFVTIKTATTYFLKLIPFDYPKEKFF